MALSRYAELSPRGIALLDHAISQIDDRPESWDQSLWWCGTSGCVAGWVCQLAGSETHDGVTAANLLNLAPIPRLGHPMFAPLNNRTALAVWHALLTGRPLPNVRGADLRVADLCGADLYGADLHGADLYAADLRGANLRGADLYAADLRGADLRGADLRGANLYAADLRGANLRGAWGVTA